MPTPWARYLKEVTARAPQHEIVVKTGIGHTAISRWLKGKPAHPSAEHAIAFARAYNRPPGEALVAAGYLQASEVWATGPIPVRPMEELSNEELVAEIERYWIEGGRGVIEMVSRFLGRPMDFGGALLLNVNGEDARDARRTDPGRLSALSDAQLLVAATDLAYERSAIMDEIGRRLLASNRDSAG